MPTCCAPGCTSGYDPQRSSGRHFFSTPTDAQLAKAWEEAIPRSDWHLAATSRVCDLHFKSTDIIKTFEHEIQGERVVIPRDKWLLRANAVPCIFSTPPPLFNTATKRKKGKAFKTITNEDAGGDEVCTPATVNSLTTFTALLNLVGQHRFEGWSVDTSVEQHIIFYSLAANEGIVTIERAVALKEDLTVTVSSKGKLVPQSAYRNPCPQDQLPLLVLGTLAKIKSFLSYVARLKLCEGISTTLCPNITTSTVAVQEGNVWHKKSCSVLSESSCCPECVKLKRQLQRQGKAAEAQPTPSQSASRKVKKHVKKRTIRTTAIREKLQREIRNLKRQLSTVTTDTIDAAIESLPRTQQLAFQSALTAMKAKSSRGRRYNMEWLMTCLLLRISSPKAYNLMTKMNLLPLPSTSRLQQIIKGAPCEFGFNKIALTSIGAQFQDKEGHLCCGTLILDEMKVRKAVSFNTRTYKLDGFVDYGEDLDQQDKTADHALVLMFVPLFHNWVQPIASFATRGAAPGAILARLVLQAIFELNKHNAVVVAVISDGAATNKAMWSKFGVSGKLESPRHRVEHPCDPELYLYFMCDTPHLIKCIRNHLLRHQYGMIGEHKINFDHYRLLYEAEGREQLRAAYKLTKEHVAPDNLRKMNVRLAVQLFSNSTASGLKVYQHLKYPGLEDCEGTIEFTARVNDLFDALNVKLPARGIRGNWKEIKIVTDFLELVDVTERNHNTRGTVMFASSVTMESLRVTLASVRDLISDLLHGGAHYVLTGKLNQDPLERFFGMVRSFAGDEDHPTTVSFTHIYRLLSLYAPIKACIQGNVTGEQTHVLATTEEAMRQKKQQHKAAHEKLKDIINEKLALICDGAREQGEDNMSDHSYGLPSSQDCIIYYVCGYIVHSFAKHTTCRLCMQEIQSEQSQCPESYFTLQKEFKQGSLKHPSQKLFHMLRGIEHHLAAALKDNQMCSDMFWLLLEALDSCHVSRLGCETHKDTFTSELLMSYVTLRMHFFVRDSCKMLSESQKVATARKKAKLL